MAGFVRPSAVSGALVAMCFFLFLDAVLIANKEVNPHDHFTFVLALPYIFSILGFVVVNATEPSQFHDITTDAAKSRGFLFAGWVLLLSASAASLVQCSAHFVGIGTRESVFPGIALVLVSALMPLAAVALWWSKGTVSPSEEFEW